MLKLISENLHANDDGGPLYVYEGVGHSDEDIIAATREDHGDDLFGMRLNVFEGNWGWSPRFKYCSRHDSGWGCDEEGEWHRHFSMGYSGVLSTAVFVNSMMELNPREVYVEFELKHGIKPHLATTAIYEPEEYNL